eukprot:3934061-Prymnesium_polylepis.2
MHHLCASSVPMVQYTTAVGYGALIASCCHVQRGHAAPPGLTCMHRTELGERLATLRNDATLVAAAA